MRVGYSGSPLRRPSWSAKSLCNSIAKLKGGFRRSIGDGKSIGVCDEIWAGDSTVKLRRPTIDLGNVKCVADLGSNAGRWNLSLIRSLFNNESVERIMASRPPREGCEDGFWWSKDKLGSLATKSAYWQLITPH